MTVLVIIIIAFIGLIIYAIGSDANSSGYSGGCNCQRDNPRDRYYREQDSDNLQRMRQMQEHEFYDKLTNKDK